ncbi:SGT1 protein [Necator americanus]|uniref:SGT1 protein n=1 Tax=Necator americanus TaxID=51031 RepID=W2TKV1_NECAM|nr:SGT1 protein [Necator americanus]ETN82244.1 SGT1 protein [Necator americanus]
MVDNFLYYYLYRGGSCHSNNELIEAIIEEIKNYVFDDRGIILSPHGYSGIPLQGETPLTTRTEDLWKIIDILFKMSTEFEGLVFRIATTIESDNLFYREAERNEVLPKWVAKTEDFTQRVYGFGGVLHVVSPELNAKFPNMTDIDIVRKHSRESRNILITEAVKQRLMTASSRNFGMQRTSVNLPSELAYIARQRPELLSAAIREYARTGSDKDEVPERCSPEGDDVMVHVLLNATDWQTVTAVADIEMPCDIVSHRVSRALIAFDHRHSSIQNGVHIPDDTQLFKRVTDRFERERLSFLFSTLFKAQNSLTHTYQIAKICVSDRHLAECRKLFKDGMSSSSEARNSACSGDDESDSKTRESKRHVYKKRRGDLGKKRVLAAIVPKTEIQTPCEEEAPPVASNTGQLRHFERAVNGDDVYKESSEERSLGEEEDMDLFITKPKPKLKNMTLSAKTTLDISAASDDDGGFDVSELMNAVPPIAVADEDFDDI